MRDPIQQSSPNSVFRPLSGASIVIPVCNALEFARDCVASVYEVRTSVPFEVIVVNNGSTPEITEWLAREQRKHWNFISMHFDRPLGFPRAVNEGARRAAHDKLVLLNSDTLVTDGWLERLAEALDSDPRLGVVSPVSNYAGNPLQIDPEAKLLHPRRARRHAAKIRNRKALILEPERLAFFCVMIRPAVWDLLAGLQEDYGPGTGEDNDFCLRARLAGYRLAVAPNAFVFHHQGHSTFRANGIDRGAWITRNQLLYCDRASRWATSTEFTGRNEKQSLPEVSIIVPVSDDRISGLRDSLASLANQTVCRFQTIVVSGPGTDLSDAVHPFDDRLQITTVAVDRAHGVCSAALLNAGLAAANRQWIAYLSAGDIYYPFHMELLSEALRRSQAEAVYTAWAVLNRTVLQGSVHECRSVVRTHDPEPGQLGLDNYPPLSCWMHSRRAAQAWGFDESLGMLSEWQFVLRLSKQTNPQYVPRVSFERRIGPVPTAPAPSGLAEAHLLLEAFPGIQPWQIEHRTRFLKAVEMGNSSEFPLLSAVPSGGQPISKSPNQAQKPREFIMRAVRGAYRALVPIQTRYAIDRRARLLLRLPSARSDETRRLQPAAKALEKAMRDIHESPHPPVLPDILLFSAVPWDHLVQRPHHFARELARRGHRVFWVDLRLKPPELMDPAFPTREIEPGVWYVELPATVGTLYQLNWDAATLSSMETAVALIRASSGIGDVIQLVNRPKWAPLAFRLRDRFGWPIIYDCVDDVKAFAAMNRHDGADFEDELARRCDLLVACSHLLYENVRRQNPKTIEVLNAGDYNLFHSAVPAGLLNYLPRPIVGFVGAFSDWLDLDWVADAAHRFPRWSFVYIGRRSFASTAARERWRSLASAANIHVFPQQDLPRLATYLAEFDVCTMPFRLLPMTRIMNAVKIYEYLAAGKPVVVPDIPELRPLAERGLIAMYRDFEQSFCLLEQAVQSPEAPDQISARFAFAAENTWAKRVDNLVARFPAFNPSGVTEISEPPKGQNAHLDVTLPISQASDPTANRSLWANRKRLNHRKFTEIDPC